MFAFENIKSGDTLVQKSPVYTIKVLSKSVIELFDSEHEIKIIGILLGENMNESILTNEEWFNAIYVGNLYHLLCDKSDINYDKYFVDGNVE
ncbi:polysaccharide biosynthesis protein [Clostridium perfringens]|uniref:polysaccharide biosynthesis protein n=1 Tax=Clostridium perfringens TaxID=1502 RepID=UPI003AF71D79